MSIGIVVKKYEHFNRSLPNWDCAKGKYISSKKQYVEELAKGGFVPYEQGNADAEKANPRKEYKLSDNKMKFLQSVKLMADKKGNIPITDRFVKGLQEHKVLPKNLNSMMDKLPKHYQDKGGFNCNS